MSLISILFLPVLFFIGFVTSYEDIKYGKIRNKWIILGISWGLGVLLLLFTWNLIANQVTEFFQGQIRNSLIPVLTIHSPFLFKSLINFVIAVASSFFMWRFNIWAAGDAKLFMVYSLLVPITYYWKSPLPFFPAMTLLINIFTIIILYLFAYSVFLFIKSIYKRTTADKFIGAKNNFVKRAGSQEGIKAIKNMGKFMTGVLLIILLLVFFREQIQNIIPFKIVFLQATIFSLIIIFSRQIAKFFQNFTVFKIVIGLLILVCFLELIIDYQFTLKSICRVLISVIVFMIAFFLLQKLLNIYVNKIEYEEIKIEDLGPKMILTPQMHKKFNLGPVKYFIKGLTPEQVNLARQRAKNMDLKTVYIQKPFPFAIWIFIGVLVTLLFKGSLISLILNFVS